MPRRIRVPQRVVQHVRVAVQRLRVCRVRHKRIRADEAAQRRVVVARAIVHQPGVGVKFLSGEGVVGGERAGFRGARRAVCRGQVVGVSANRAAGIWRCIFPDVSH